MAGNFSRFTEGGEFESPEALHQSIQAEIANAGDPRIRSAANFLVTVEADRFWSAHIDSSGSLATDPSAVDEFPRQLYEEKLQHLGIALDDVAEVSDSVRDSIQNHRHAQYLCPPFEPIGEFATREDFDYELNRFLDGRMTVGQNQLFIRILKGYILELGLDSNDSGLISRSSEEDPLIIIECVQRTIGYRKHPSGTLDS